MRFLNCEMHVFLSEEIFFAVINEWKKIRTNQGGCLIFPFFLLRRDRIEQDSNSRKILVDIESI